jgi:hypothetical protein
MPYVPKAGKAPDPIVCHDAIGHNPKFKPWITGGRCCCTPTRENFEIHRKNGTIDRSMTYEQYLALYKERSIVTDIDHAGCGNYCDHGPHVTLGGKCMATPVPGTGMYEMITYGPHRNLLAEGKGKKKKDDDDDEEEDD